MKKIIFWVLMVSGVILVMGMLAYQKTYQETPNPGELITELQKVGEPSIVYDRAGGVLLQFGEKTRVKLELADLLNHPIVDILIATEDKTFWKHDGVDYKALLRAAKGVVTGKNLGGGSSITQQLAKIIYTKRGSSDMRKRVMQKWREIVLAQKLEQALKKEEILLLYLNNMDFSMNTIGVASAARRYYGKNFGALNEMESAGLVAMLQNPVAFNPINNHGAWEQKTHSIATRLRIEGRTPTIKPSFEHGIKDFSILYYHIQEEMKNLGYNGLTGSGLSIYTTLDGAIQKELEKILKTHVQRLPTGSDGGIVVLDSNGAIVALVGGTANQNWCVSKRPVGSTIKPLVHGLAYDLGIITPCTPWTDTSYTIRNGKYGMTSDYTPDNFSPHTGQTMWYGEALRKSLNNGTVALLDDPSKGLLDKLKGVISATSSRSLPPSSVLGAIDMSLLELGQLYTAFSPAHPGTIKQKPLIATIKSRMNETVYRNENGNTHTVLTPETTATIQAILYDNQGGFAGKTGTTNDEKDALYSGWNNEFTVAIRIASRNGRSVGTGSTIAKPLASKVFSYLHSVVPVSKLVSGQFDYSLCATAPTKQTVEHEAQYETATNE